MPSNPYVRKISEVLTIDGHLSIGVDYDSVSLSYGPYIIRMTKTNCEEFAELFASACWEAADNAAHMRMDAALADDERTTGDGE